MTAPWRRLRALALGVSLGLVLSGCGYNLAGRGSFLPDRIRTIGIPPFDSAVPRPGVVQKLTDAVTSEFIARGGYRIVPQTAGADAVLSGAIVGLVQTPVAFDDQGRVTRALLTVTAGVRLSDAREGALLYENPSFVFRTEVELSEEGEDFFDPESEALDEIASSFGRSLVATIVEGF
jgi:outer membrane lipopolysaccharide assembly protein LptE/RlpB